MKPYDSKSYVNVVVSSLELYLSIPELKGLINLPVS
jgi:hypothetical protein